MAAPHPEAAQPLHASYQPRSKGKSPGTLIPANMATAAQLALDKLEAQRGDIDEFVRQRLGYETKEELWKRLYAEQIDAVALAFHQRDRGKVFLNGDQTGNGKGRFGASNIIDALNQGYIPVFVTQKPNLYASMLADLADIGKPGIRPFMTNSNLSLALENGQKLKTGSPAQQESEMRRIVQEGSLGLAYNAVFTTYSQLQTVNDGKEPFRREFFRAIAPQAVFIFDEAHEAGGSTGEKGWKSLGDAPDRSEFVRELIDLSAGAVFMSATATKDPAVMDLYARRSDAAEAVSNLASLQRTLQDGGIPLQQMMATKFVASGQLLRRERSFEGVSFEAKVVPVNRETADGISAIMRSISQFDLVKQKAIKELSKDLKKEAKQLGEDNAIGQVGAKSTNFTSLMHNVIDQGLLCQKAEATVQAAIASIHRGEKPVIAVASTMDAFIGQYAEDNGLTPGDALDISFGDVLSRYLERSRDVVIKNHEGLQTRRRLTDEELGPDAQAAYDEARELIESVDLSAIPLSSIDYIRWRLTQEGYQVDEITGRENVIDYTTNGEIGYGRRSTKETTAQAKVDIVDRFNSGDLDVLILNRSGATGINLHASEKFADQRQRHLIVAQAERDINQVMQMLGRVNRFGQVVEPKITLLMSDLPAEKRLGAILSKKMATLNVNTTAARDSSLSVSNVVDFMNPYGEEVIGEILEDNLDLDAKLAYPTQNLQGNSETELISRVTGRIPLLSIQEQEDLYTLIETETLDLIAQKEAMGESILRAEQLDLDARVLARMEVLPDTSGIQNEFTGPVYLEVSDTKVPVKPLTQLQVINTVRENLGMEPAKQVEDHDFEIADRRSKHCVRQTLDQLKQDLKGYRSDILQNKRDPYSRDKAVERIKDQLAHLTTVLTKFPPGQSVRVVSPEGNITYGVVSRIWQKGRDGSPAAPTNWRAEILTDNQARVITVPLTRFNRGKDNLCTTVTAEKRNWNGENIYQAFDLRQAEQRRESQIFSGNLLKAYEKYPSGKFINYSDHQGNIRQGLIMPASFDIQESLRTEPVLFHEPYQVKAFLTDITQNQGAVKTLDEILTIKNQMAARSGQGTATGFVLQTPKSVVGDQFSLDSAILESAGGEFYSVSDRMELIVPAERIDQVLNVVMKYKGHTLAAFDFKDQAREYLGLKLPHLEVLEHSQKQLPQKEVVPPPVEVPLAVIPGNPPQKLTQIAPPEQQETRAEKSIARFLQKAELLEAVMVGEDFHLRIDNEPYIPLVIERHGNELYLTHYLSQNGDSFIDSEMVFTVQDEGQLQLQEVATQNPFSGGESRRYDRPFAQLFARNILDQGFAEAAVLCQQNNVGQIPVNESSVQPGTTSIEPYEAEHNIELGRGQEILDIAARIYAHAESMGRVKPDETLEFWSVIGKDYQISYNPSNDNFFITGTQNSLMEAQSIGGQIDLSCTSNISEADLNHFRSTNEYLNQIGVPIDQTPAQTQAIAQMKWEKAQALMEEQTTLFSLGSYSSEAPAIELASLDPAWNQQDTSTQTPAAVEQPAQATEPKPQPTLEDLREWYRQAREIGRSENHLMKIEQAGKAFAKGENLSEQDLAVMARDQAKWQKQVYAIATHAKSILTHLGEPFSGGTCFEGKKDYTLFSQNGNLYALASGRGIQPSLEDQAILPHRVVVSGRGIILKLEQDSISFGSTRTTTQDAERFEQFARLVETKVLSQHKLGSSGAERG